MRALVLGDDGAPLAKAPVATLEGRTQATAGAQGRLVFRGLRPGECVLSMTSDGSSLYLRRGREAVDARNSIRFEVKQTSGTLDLGTVVAEAYTGYKARMAATFGPACDAVVAGRRPPKPLPADAIPVCLDRDAGGPWDYEVCPNGVGYSSEHFHLLCETESRRKVGTYTMGGDAHDIRWTISVLTADGMLRSKSLSAPAPQMVKVEIGSGRGAYSVQFDKLDAARRDWLDSLKAKKAAGG